jgi:Kdo2-lipid IVA lauroyltransferase/acyltransferase
MSSFKKLRKNSKYTLLVAAIKVLLVVIRVLPRKVSMQMAAGLGSMAFWLLKEERFKTISNLTITYGEEKSAAEIAAMAKEVWVNLGKSGVEFAIKMGQEKPEEFFKDLEVRGNEYLQEAFRKGRGVLGLISHMGCWEGTAMSIPMLGFPAYAIGKRLGNEKLNALLFESRGKKGVPTLARGSSYKTILRILRENNLIGILIDQDTEVRGVFVDFYGRPAYTPIGAAMLAMDSGAPVLPIFYLKKDDDTYEFIIEKEIALVMTGNRRQDMEENTRRFHAVIEKYIKKYPTQWVWMHNRWKTTPEMVQEREKTKRKTA